MGMVVMSKRELNRLDVLARLDSDRLTARAAAELMFDNAAANVSAVEKVSRWRRFSHRQPAPRSSLEQPLAGCSSRSCDCSGAGALRRLWSDIRSREAGRAS